MKTGGDFHYPTPVGIKVHKHCYDQTHSAQNVFLDKVAQLGKKAWDPTLVRGLEFVSEKCEPNTILGYQNKYGKKALKAIFKEAI